MSNVSSSDIRAKIRTRSLYYDVGGARLLEGVDAVASEGKITAVVGPSGAGKSTFLRTINRLVEPTSGEVYLSGEPTGSMDTLQLRRRVGMVFQIPALFGASVEEAILYGPRLIGKEADVSRLLEIVGLDALLAGREPDSLSVGQQQRVSIARTLALQPEVLMMDEPTSALDEAARRTIEELVRDLNVRLGLTVLFVSHDLSQVERIADDVLLLVEGRSQGQWPKEEFFAAEGGPPAKRLVFGGL
jgi:ABC-type methionine transport system ATPase subunit